MHWLHVALVTELLATGALLYVPAWRTRFVTYHMAIRWWHLGTGAAWILLLCGSLPAVVRYARLLGGRPAIRRMVSRGHITWLYCACLAWAASGAMMADLHHFPLTWRGPATRVHDLLSVLLIPWASLHVAGILTRRWRHRLSRRFRMRGGHPNLSLPEDSHADFYRVRSLSRRQFLLYGGAAALAFLAGGLWKWFEPRLAPITSTVPERRGRFRLYNVAETTPNIRPGQYTLEVRGLVKKPATFTMAQLAAFPQVSMTRAFYCVSGWTVTNVTWSGVPLAQILQEVQPLPEARYMTVYSLDGVYFDSYTFEQFSKVDVLLAFQMDGAPLQPSQGGPCRIVFPALYGYKSVKWVGRIEFTADRKIGYWEQRGYDLNGELPLA
ncbi:MAG: molybdopterin-dependent oxidoreductase [Alicyclobacillus macrosporangiidus]|uniref:molybdopterin-dependent oxidoreductase n=1 Tax=Alicyclobacillus macrosporangiidus TaxID=392015 RepID=UPI0026EA937F|nr:molybdopterin-dependent oxidoreductase [Alicyclobacillus macrosporangiidus]MCL6598511.1 molybdopterin-dependent oxidoreductase [Alicyclobacillus macrosporangiidus]